jgi:TonB family protein
MPPPEARSADPPDLDLLRNWREPASPGRILRAGIGSILVHIVAVIVFLSLPEVVPSTQAPAITADLRRAVHLVAPRNFEPTQKAPNPSKARPELDVRSSLPAPQSQAPRFRPPTPPPGPIAQNSVLTPVPAPVIEPPKIEAAPAALPPIAVTTPPIAPAPPAQERSKLAFENIGPAARPSPNPNSQIPLPKTSVQDAARSAVQPGGGGVTVGDIGADPNTIPGINQVPTPGKVGSNLQLLSDPKGVDFKPYLIQVLNAVRRNWMAIIPESARMGRRGTVLIQFIIDRRGAVPKLVIADASGTEAFDRAAVAGISASSPFPPLPAEYNGDQIRLQLAFSYNMPSR